MVINVDYMFIILSFHYNLFQLAVASDAKEVIITDGNIDSVRNILFAVVFVNLFSKARPGQTQ